MINGSPIVATVVLTLLIGVLAAVVGLFVVGAEDTGDYGGSALQVSFDRGDETATVLVMDMKGADHVEVTFYGWGDRTTVRLEETGARAVLSEHELVVTGGTIEGTDETVVDAATAPFALPEDEDEVSVHAVGVAPKSEKVLRHESGSI